MEINQKIRYKTRVLFKCITLVLQGRQINPNMYRCDMTFSMFVNLYLVLFIRRRFGRNQYLPRFLLVIKVAILIVIQRSGLILSRKKLHSQTFPLDLLKLRFFKGNM